MEITREIYWNVGHGVLIPMYVISVSALSLMIYGFVARIRVYRLGKPAGRTDHLKIRIMAALTTVLSQQKILREKTPGIPHSLIFWAFLAMFMGTVLIFIQADLTDPLWGWIFLSGNFYKLFSLVLDLAGLLAIVMLLVMLVRRYWVRPPGLESDRNHAVMHGLLLAILTTGFVIEGARMAVTELDSPTNLAVWSPMGLFVAHQMADWGEKNLRLVHMWTWWVHFLLVMGFLVILPRTRLRHIVTTAANYVFADQRRKGSIDTLDLEDEAVESFGVQHIADFSWKDILDGDACTQCKRCQDQCPAWNTDKPLTPMKLINHIKEKAFSDPDGSLIDTIGRDALWACTTCRNCQDICPAGVEHVNKIIDMRRYLVLMEGDIPGDEVMTAVDQLEVNGNPLGMTFSSRGDWARELDVIDVKEDSEVDILYFTGCYASFDKRNISVARSFVRLCQAAGIRVGILGKAEKCCGEPARKMGNEYLYQTLATDMIERIQGSGIKKVVTACPHCFNTLDRDYRDFGFQVPVEHYVTFLNNLVRQGRLAFKQQPFKCTYHDSCYLGRYNDIYQPPRDLLAVAGADLHEMEKNCQEAAVS
jgi:Fe-S oxidoreductase/nitrate reductase gamma subunit